MKFFKAFLWNLGLLLILGLVLYVAFPKIIGQAYQFLGMAFGPVIIILMIVVAALPSRRRRY